MMEMPEQEDSVIGSSGVQLAWKSREEMCANESGGREVL